MDKKRIGGVVCLLLATVAAVCLGGPGARAGGPEASPAPEKAGAEETRQTLRDYFNSRYSEATCSALYVDLTGDGLEELVVLKLAPDRNGEAIPLHDGGVSPERFNGGTVTVFSAVSGGITTLYDYRGGREDLGGVFLTARGGQPCLEERLPDGETEVISLAEDAAPAEPREEKALLFWDGQLLLYLDELFTVWE